MGADVLEINSIKIEDTSEKLKKYLSKLEDYNHILFTSVNAVNIFFDYLIKYYQYFLKMLLLIFYLANLQRYQISKS